MTENLDVRRRRAAYRANHRGTKEMDWVLGKFADATLGAMDERDLVAFERLINEPDPELHQWFVSPSTCVNSEFLGLVVRLREFHKLEQGQQPGQQLEKTSSV